MLTNLKKIAIIGNAGSGKTTLAFKLHEKLGLPIYHLDQYCWNPGWKKIEFETFKRIHDDLCQKDSWIIEGSYYRLLRNRALQADVIVYLDIPTYICLWRVLKRAIFHYGEDIPGNPSGCKQDLFTFRFWEFLKWIWGFNKKHGPEILNILKEFEKSKQIYILQSQEDINEFSNKITHGISFKPLEQSGIRQIYDWIQQPHVSKWWSDLQDWFEFKKKFEDKIRSPYRSCFVIYIENKAVGYIQSYVANKFPEWPSEKDSTYGMDLFIGDIDYIGKGYGSRIVKQFVQELFKSSKVMRVIINPDINNSAAIKAYERAGFRAIKEIKRQSETELLMEIIRPII